MRVLTPDLQPTRRYLAPLIAAALLLCLFPSAAAAQDRPTVTVVIVDTVGFSDDEMFEFRYGVEQIVRDYGELELVDPFDLRDRLSPAQRRELDGCWSETSCFIDALSGSTLDGLLIVETEAADDGFTAHISTVDLADRQVVAEQEGYFPDPGNSLFLLAPIFETLAPLTETDEEPTPIARPEPERPEPQPWLLPPDDKPERNILATSFMAGGGALMLVGVTFYILADGTQEDIQTAPHDRAELEDLQSRGQTQQTVGNITLISGAVLLAAGIVFELTGIGAPGDDFDFDDDDDWVRLNLGAPFGSPYVEIEVGF